MQSRLRLNRVTGTPWRMGLKEERRRRRWALSSMARQPKWEITSRTPFSRTRHNPLVFFWFVYYFIWFFFTPPFQYSKAADRFLFGKIRAHLEKMGHHDRPSCPFHSLFKLFFFNCSTLVQCFRLLFLVLSPCFRCCHSFDEFIFSDFSRIKRLKWQSVDGSIIFRHDFVMGVLLC